MTDKDKQIIESFLSDPPVKAEPSPVAARYRARRAATLTRDSLHCLRNAP
jgi:hypothetical protein